MLLFASIAALIVLIALFLLLFPVLRQRKVSSVDARAEALAIFRQQFSELEQDHTSGIIADAQYQQSREELERRMLEEAEAIPASAAPAPRMFGNKRIALILAVIVPVVSGLLYYKLGNPLAITQPAAEQAATPAGHMAGGDLDQMLDRLKQKLEKTPGDAAGWALLARSYQQVGRYQDAVSTYAKVVTLIPNDAALWADYADAKAMSQGRSLAGEPQKLVEKALSIDPNNVKALMLAGTIEFDQKHYARAIEYWERQRALLPADSEEARRAAATINEARNLMGSNGQLDTINEVAAAPAPAAPSTKPAAAAGATAITGSVTITSTLASKVNPAAVLFVYARTATGSPMPIAIVRTSARDLPYTFRLDDTTSMTPDSKLSSAGEVIVVARLSVSGQAMPMSGDIRGELRGVKPGTQGVKIVMDTLIP